MVFNYNAKASRTISSSCLLNIRYSKIAKKSHVKEF